MHVLVIDDEKNIRKTLSVCLEGMGCSVSLASSEDEALTALLRQAPDLVFLDLRLGAANGLDVLSRLLGEQASLDVIVITAYSAIDTAVEAIKRGAEDYLPKPFTPPQIRQIVERIAKRRKLQTRVLELENQLADEVPEAYLNSQSPEMQHILDLVLRAAPSDASVLFLGESGTGKGVLAKALHAASNRAAGPFVTVNCPALSEELLASELFGHSRGSFTGAVRDQAGQVEAAHHGTLFLDEIGEMPQALQAKVLRFLQEKKFERLGETKTRQADVRVVAATNRNLQEAVQSGEFRLDLLYRLNVVEITVPPLRERPQDLLALARYFLNFFARSQGRKSLSLSEDAEQCLLGYAWPGNIRELRNEIERAVVLSRGIILTPTSFSSRIAARLSNLPSLGGNFTLDQIEREHIARVLARTKTQEEAAHILGIDASTLWRKRKRHEDLA